MKRALFGFVFLGVILYASWWVVLAVMLSGLFLFPWYVEAVIGGILFDILYGVQGSLLFGFGMLALIVSIISFFAMEKFKKNLR